MRNQGGQITMNGMDKAAVMNRVNEPPDLVECPLPEVKEAVSLQKYFAVQSVDPISTLG
jgi:hypothetical protein